MRKKERQRDNYRIAFYGHKSIPSREGGIEVVVQEMSVRMADSGHDVTCLNRGGNHKAYETSLEVKNGKYQGVKLKTVPTIDKSGLAAASSSFFAAWKAALGPYDIVHIHAEGPAAFCWIPKMFGKRIVVTVHGLDWKRDKWHGFAKKYIHYGERVLASYADKIIVLSQDMKKYFKDEYNRETEYIPNGTECPDLVSADLIKSQFGLEKDEYILYLGRLVPEKKADVLIKAFRETQTDKKLVIAGPDSNTDEYIVHLHELADGDPRIIFTGFVKDRLYEELMSNAYVYVLPSKLEGMPLSLLEAMSYGNCCITSNIPECKEVIGNHGVLVEPEDIEGLQSAMQSLIDHPSVVERYREEAREFVDYKDGWDEVVDKTLELYRESDVAYDRRVFTGSQNLVGSKISSTAKLH